MATTRTAFRLYATTSLFAVLAALSACGGGDIDNSAAALSTPATAIALDDWAPGETGSASEMRHEPDPQSPPVAH